MSLELFSEPAPTYGDSHDFWSTPRAAWEPIEPVLLDATRGRGRVHVLEPACGEGVLVELAMSLEPRSVTTYEVHAGRAASCWRDWGHATNPVVADFLTAEVAVTKYATVDNPLCVVMNPPYTKPRKTIGLEFVTKCLELARPSRGIVCALLPHDWATGVAWGEIHDRDAACLYPVRRRPKFNGEETGKRPVAWFLWDLLNPRREWRVIG